MLADQAVSSLGNVAMAVAAAHAVSKTSFGQYSAAVLVYVLAVGLTRSLSSDCLMVFGSDLPPRRFRHEARASTGMALAAGCAVAAVVAGGSAAVGEQARCVLVMAPFVPALCLQDAWRFTFFAKGRPGAAVVNDTVWAVLSVGAALVLIGRHTTDPRAFALAWAATGGLAGALGIWQAALAPRMLHARRYFRAYRKHALRFLGDFAVYSTGVQVTILLLAVPLSVADIGAIQGAQTLLGPATTLSTGLGLAAVAEGARIARTPRLLARRTALLAGALAVMVGAWAALTLVAPASVGRRLFGDSWHGVRSVLPLLGVAAISGAVAAAPVAGLRALAQSRRLLRARLVIAPAMVTATMGGAVLWGRDGAAGGLAAASAFGAALMAMMFRASVAGHEVPAVASGAVQEAVTS